MGWKGEETYGVLQPELYFRQSWAKVALPASGQIFRSKLLLSCVAPRSLTLTAGFVNVNDQSLYSDSGALVKRKFAPETKFTLEFWELMTNAVMTERLH